jgi:outer membrane immunogenic protein
LSVCFAVSHAQNRNSALENFVIASARVSSLDAPLKPSMTRFPPFTLIALCAALFGHNATAQSRKTSWTGFYIGGNFGDSSDRLDFGDTSETFSVSGFMEKVPGKSIHGDNSFLGGGQVGYDHQFGMLVLGLEWDADWISHQASFHRDSLYFRNRYPFGDAIIHADHLAELNLINSLRARAGVGWQRFLFYVTGGLALGDLTMGTNDVSLVPGNPRQAASGSDSGLAIGWAAGGGAECSITRAISIAAEFQHRDLGGDYKPTNNSQLFDARGRVDFADDEVALRVNVHLNAFFGR